MSRIVVAATTLALVVACGGNDRQPVSFSQPVGISLPVASKDVVAGAVSAEKNINTESGNPYGAFTTAARDRLGGRDPSHIVVTAAGLELLPSSTGVTKLEEVFTGPVRVSFVSGASGTEFPVGEVADPVGAGPVNLLVAFDSAQLPVADRDAIAQGQFKVVLTGTTPDAFATAGATADLKATFTFIAYE